MYVCINTCKYGCVLAVCADAVARRSRSVGSYFIFILSLFNVCARVLSFIQYTQAQLHLAVNNSTLGININNWDCISLEIWWPATGIQLTIPPLKRCRSRRQKRSKRRGLKAKLKTNPNKPAIPGLFLANTQLLNNKMDKLKLRSANVCS